MGICIQRTNYENNPVRNEWITFFPSLLNEESIVTIDVQWTTNPLSAFNFESFAEAIYWSSCIIGSMVVRFGAEEVAPVEDKEAIETERLSKSFATLIEKRAELGDIVAIAIKSEKNTSE